MQAPKLTREEIANYDSLRAWKTDDKEWVKERRKKWPDIKRKLDQLAEYVGLDRKRFKYCKSYFMTGYAIKPTLEEVERGDIPKQPILMYGHWEHFLLKLWLSPDHSAYNIERYRSLAVLNSLDEKYEESEYYHVSSWIRRIFGYYQQYESYLVTRAPRTRYRLSRFYNEGSIFDGLEPLLLEAFPLNTEEIKPYMDDNEPKANWFSFNLYLNYLNGKKQQVPPSITCCSNRWYCGW